MLKFYISPFNHDYNKRIIEEQLQSKNLPLVYVDYIQTKLTSYIQQLYKLHTLNLYNNKYNYQTDNFNLHNENDTYYKLLLKGKILYFKSFLDKNIISIESHQNHNYNSN